MVSSQPEWSGLQVAGDQASGLEVDLRSSEKETSPIEYHAPAGKIASPSEASRNGSPLQKLPDHAGKIVHANAATTSSASSNPSEEKQFQPMSPPRSPSTAHRRRRSSRLRFWTLIILLILIVAIVVAVPTGVILGRQKQTSDTTSINSNQNNGTLTQDQFIPFNGTRFASIEPRSGTDRLWVFWQDVNGNIRLSKINSAGLWEPSVDMNITNAVNGTALAAAVHNYNGPSGGLNHLVYYTSDRRYADLINDPTKGDGWTDGGLYDLAILGPLDPSFYMAWSIDTNGTGWLYCAAADWPWWTEHRYDVTSRQWATNSHLFEHTNAFGGIATEQYNNITQIKVVTPKQQIASWSRDPSSTTSSQWARDNNTFGGIWPNTSLASPHAGSDTTSLFYQNPDQTVSLATSSSYYANSTWLEEVDTGIRGMAGTALHVAEVVFGSNGKVTTVLFLQETGADISIYIGDGTQLTRNGTLPT